MKVSAYDTFVAMYYALDAAYDEIKDEELRAFLSDANPFLFKDEGSADPAIFAEFSEEFEAEFKDGASEQESLDFVRDYLRSQNATVLIATFDTIVDSAKWAKALNR